MYVFHWTEIRLWLSGVARALKSRRKRPQRLDPRRECLFPSPICFVLRPFQFVYIWPLLERDSLLIYCLGFLRVPLRAYELLPTADFRPCSDINPPDCWFLKVGPLFYPWMHQCKFKSYVINDEWNIHACRPTHVVQAFSTYYKCLYVLSAPSGWLVFMFCDISLYTLIFLMKGPQNCTEPFPRVKGIISEESWNAIVEWPFQHCCSKINNFPWIYAPPAPPPPAHLSPKSGCVPHWAHCSLLK